MPYRLLIVDDPDAREVLRETGARVLRPNAVQAVVRGAEVDAVLGSLAERLGATPAVAIVPVEALAAGAPVASAALREPTAFEAFVTRDRLSTEEIRDDVEEGARLTRSFLAMAVASAVIAAFGMRGGQTAVVIGAMVIAPLLGPCMALAMAATVGDGHLARRAGAALGAGALAAFAATVAMGALVVVDPLVPELAARTSASPADVALALASGAAGVLAFCRGLSASLVGVMIAVALVPPLAAAGLFAGAALAGQGPLEPAGGALLLFATNLVCINVAGIATFLAQGLPPRTWRATGGVLAVWLALLGALVVLISA